MLQSAGSVERALPGRTTLTLNVTDSRGCTIHESGRSTRRCRALTIRPRNPAASAVSGTRLHLPVREIPDSIKNYRSSPV